MKIFKIFICIILLIIFLNIPIYIFAFDESEQYIWSSDSVYANSNTITNNTTSTVSSLATPSSDSLNLESGAALLMEQSTGKILYSKNEHEQLRPASVTKIMSILLIMEQIDNGYISYSDKISCSETARSMGGSQIWLDTKETLSVDEMLKAICVVSANDCVMAMAEHIAGSEEAFVQMMNDKAKELGMNDTCFKNCHGIDEDGHVTSAYDIAIMSRELLIKHSSITKYTTIWMDSLRDGKSELVNTNKLIRTYKGITGLKTGSTSLALYNLSASATRNDLSLISVIMKSPSTKIRFAEATKLLDYGFSKYSFKKFGNKDDEIQTLNINKGVKSTAKIILKEDAGAFIEKGKENQISQSIEFIDNISAPIKCGDKVGQINFSLDNELISSVDLISAENIEKINIFSMSKKTIYNWINLLR